MIKKLGKLLILSLVMALQVTLMDVIPVQAVDIIPEEIKSRGNIETTSHGAEAPDGVFAIADLWNLRDDYFTCQETAEATRKPMVYALALKGVTVPENASYSEIAEGILQIPDEYTWVDVMDGVIYDYHNHVDDAGEKTNDIDNSGVYSMRGGCYTEPVYHIHVGNSTVCGGCYTEPVNHIHRGNSSAYGGCYTTPVNHAHSGNSSAYGGCYTSPVYHVHSGNSTAGGGCYNLPVYHVHTGNSTASGGCYTTPVYHAHTGDSVNGGGCYTIPIPHSHNESCAHTTIRRHSEIIEGPWISDSGSRGSCGWPGCDGDKVTWTCTIRETAYDADNNILSQREYSVNKVGHCHMESEWAPYDNKDNYENDYSICPITADGYELGCGKDSSTIESYALSCGKTTSTIESYNLGCGKTTSSIDAYALGCGKTTNTVESYALGCGKTEHTVDSYALGCGLTESSVEGYSLGCQRVENQIIAAHIVYDE